MSDDVKIVRQDGTPVDDEPKPDDDGYTEYSPLDDVEALAKDIHRGAKKFRDGFLFKVGLIAVTIKAIDVVGKIVMENQRLKATAKKQDNEE